MRKVGAHIALPGWAAVGLLVSVIVPAAASTPLGGREDEVLVRGDEKLYRLRVGMRLSAVAGAAQHAVATVPVPINWPEQQVELLETETPDERLVQTRRVGDTAAQMVLRLPQLGRGASVTCIRTYEVTRWAQRLNRDAASRLRVPTGPQLRANLQPSEGIESSHAEIRRLASETAGELSGPIERADALYRVTRERIRYVQGSFVGALKGLRAGQGDCEELSSLFVALCRASGIPARVVRAPEHAWAEFALSDAGGRVVWIPADPAREPALGVINKPDPIMHKGDRFIVPEMPGRPQRFLGATCTGLGSTPHIEPIEKFEPIETPSGKL